MTDIIYKDFADSGTRYYLEQKFNGHFNIEERRFYTDFDHDGQIEVDEYVNVPVKNGRLLYNEMLGRIGRKYFPERPIEKPAELRAERKRGLTPAEYRQKVAAAKPAAKFAKGASGEAGKELDMMVTGASGLFDLCSEGTREKTGIKSGPFYAAITSTCFAGGVVEGFGRYIVGGQLFGDLATSSADIISGDPERVGRGSARLGIIGLQFSPLRKIPNMKFRSSGTGLKVTGQIGNGNAGALTISGGGTVAIDATGAFAGTAGIFSVGTKEGGNGKSANKVDGKKGRASKISEEKLAEILEEYDFDYRAAAKDKRINLGEEAVRIRIRDAKHGPLIHAQNVLFERGDIRLPRSKKLRRTSGAQYSDSTLAEFLDMHGGDIKAAAADPGLNMYPQALKERILIAREGSELLRHEKSVKSPIESGKPVITDEQLYYKLVEWDDSGNILGILDDADVQMTLTEIRKRINKSYDGHALKEFKGLTESTRLFSDNDLAYIMERNGLDPTDAAKKLGVTQDAIYKRLKKAPEHSNLGRIQFLWKNK